MEPTGLPLEPEAQSGEDFVHVDDPKSHGDISLSESIVNVEKEELLVEEHSSDSGSVITGEDPIGDSGDIGEDDISGGAEFGERSVEMTKLELPEEFAKSVMVLTCESSEEGGSCDVYLIGTAHVSQVSSFRSRWFHNQKLKVELVTDFVICGNAA